MATWWRTNLYTSVRSVPPFFSAFTMLFLNSNIRRLRHFHKYLNVTIETLPRSHPFQWQAYRNNVILSWEKRIHLLLYWEEAVSYVFGRVDFQSYGDIFSLFFRARVETIYVSFFDLSNFKNENIFSSPKQYPLKSVPDSWHLRFLIVLHTTDSHCTKQQRPRINFSDNHILQRVRIFSRFKYIQLIIYIRTKRIWS